MGKSIKKSCDQCKQEVKYLRQVKNERLCYRCYRKTMKCSMPLWGLGLVPLEEAIKKVRIVMGVFPPSHGSPSGIINVPRCFIGKRVRVILAEENGE